MLEINRVNSHYQPQAVDIGIVHIGLGAFHRAHQALYLERWLNQNGGGPWGICSANIRSNKTLVEQLTAQGCCYHVVAYRNGERVTVNEVNAIREVLFAGSSKQALLARLSREATSIVTLTVTEKGYYMVPAQRRLCTEDPDIRHDIAKPSEPKTAPGILLEALVRRKKQGIPAFTVLSCDNMPDNGVMIREAVVQLAALQSTGLAHWIEENVAFPCSMVDQIVPAMDQTVMTALREELDCDDPVAVVTESFSQWVIEDCFPMGRPDWESVGVEMVADVHPFETMKLRLLNGSHSLLAYLGCLDDWGTVAQSVAREEVQYLLRSYMAEAATTLVMPDNVNITQYCDALLTRFANDSLQHRLQQIAMDGSQKILQRWLLGAESLLKSRRDAPLTILGIAAWIHYTRGVDFHAHSYTVSDPQAERLLRLHQEFPEPIDLIRAFVSIKEIFPPYLAEHETFSEQVHSAYCMLQELGVTKTIWRYVQEPV